MAYAAQLAKVGTVAPQEGAFGEHFAPSCCVFFSFSFAESAVVSAIAVEDTSEAPSMVLSVRPSAEEISRLLLSL